MTKELEGNKTEAVNLKTIAAKPRRLNQFGPRKLRPLTKTQLKKRDDELKAPKRKTKKSKGTVLVFDGFEDV